MENLAKEKQGSDKSTICGKSTIRDKNTAYRTLVYLTLLLSVVVVGLGAYTRLTDAGLGCPDWPGCYGFVSVPETDGKIADAMAAFPDAPVEIHKAWNEMIHRYVAGTLGLLIAAIACLSWRRDDRPKVLPWSLLGLVIFQAALGMWTVTMSLMPVIVMGHLLGGFATVSLLLLLALRCRKLARSSTAASPRTVSRRSALLKTLAAGGLLAVVMQIALGGWTSANYAAMVCSQLPVCEVDWVSGYDAAAFHPVSPESDSYEYGVLGFDQRVTIHATHRIGAMVVTLLLLVLAAAIRRPLGNTASLALLAALAVQIGLGITNVVALLPLPVAVAHNLGGLALLLVTVYLNASLYPAWFNPARLNPVRRHRPDLLVLPEGSDPDKEVDPWPISTR